MDTRYNRFIILSDARTGSNLLQQALNSHPNITCFREIFNLNPQYIDYDVEGWDGRAAQDLELRTRDPSAFLETRVFTLHGSGVRAVGFKFHYGHFWLHEKLLHTLTADTSLRIIHLQRRNLLRSLVSLVIARETEQWLQHDEAQYRRSAVSRKLSWANLAGAARHPARTMSRARSLLAPINPAPARDRTRITLTYDDCVAHFYRASYNAEQYELMFREHLITNVAFEELTTDRELALHPLYDFLEVPPARSAHTTLQRQNPEPLRQLIANYDDLRASFAGTQYEQWFDD